MSADLIRRLLLVEVPLLDHRVVELGFAPSDAQVPLSTVPRPPSVNRENCKKCALRARQRTTTLPTLWHSPSIQSYSASGPSFRRMRSDSTQELPIKKL